VPAMAADASTPPAAPTPRSRATSVAPGPTGPPSPIRAVDVISLVVDPASFMPWDEDVVAVDTIGFVDRVPYPQRIREVTARSGSSESVLTGQARLNGLPIALIVGELGFIGGSVGAAASERVARAFDRATAGALPVVAATSSAGTRMQEGTLGFVQMARTTQALLNHRRAGLPYIVYLMQFTFGGVLASWGSLGHVTFAMPGARMGFTGPRVMEGATGDSMPADVQVAENFLRLGLVDDVVPLQELRLRLVQALGVLGPHRVIGDGPEPPGWEDHVLEGDAWQSVQWSRHPARPGARDVLDRWATDVTPLRGDEMGTDDPACLTALVRLVGVPAVVIAQDRAVAWDRARMIPAGYRKVRRAIRIAGDLGLPVVTLIDTPAPRLDRRAEETGLAAELARCLADLLACPAPTLSVLIGEGGGGAAVALWAADRVACAEHAWLAPILPEGASVILFRTPDRAEDLARRQGIASWDLWRFGIADAVIPEDRPAHEDRDGFVERVGAVVADELRRILAREPRDRLEDRAARYRTVGGIHRAPWGSP
jgi:acyl-CoA carboxylase subunit beta